MTPSTPPPLRERLHAEAARRFVGRGTELTLMREQLGSPHPDWPVLLVHGPGGIGKTTLLERVRTVAAELGIDSLRLDGRDVDPSPEGFLRSVGMGLGLAADGSNLERVCQRLGDAPRRLLVVDTFERLQPLEPWLRETFLPACPQGLVTILAGRMAPQREWLVDPLWLGHARVISLRNLSEEECAAYLDNQGVTGDDRDRVTALSHGHPLALALLADIARSNGALPAALATDVIRDLAGRFTAIAPSPLHRRALEICAMLRRTTEEMIAHAVDAAAASELFDWLASLNFVERGHDGLFPHDLMRDAVVAEFDSREPERFRSTRRTICQRLLARLVETSPMAAWPLACDYNFLFRYRSPIERYNDYRTMGSAHFRPATPNDFPAIAALVAEESSAEARALTLRWIAHPAATSWVAGSASGRVDGVEVTIDLDRVDAAIVADDPFVRRVIETLDPLAPPRPGRGRYLGRYNFMRGGMFTVEGGVANALQMAQWYQWMTTPGVQAWCLALPRPEWWQSMMRYFDFAPLFDDNVDIDGVPVGCYWRSWLDRAPREWALERAGAHAGTSRQPPDTATSPRDHAATPSLSRAEFAQAVRAALKHATRDTLLAANPLATTRIVQSARGPAEKSSAAIRRVLLEGARALAHPPRNEKFWRALDLTYFRPAGTQELAAERLGIPFNTYRYQLATALERLTERLWEMESTAEEP